MPPGRPTGSRDSAPRRRRSDATGATATIPVRLLPEVRDRLAAQAAESGIPLGRLLRALSTWAADCGLPEAVVTAARAMR